MAIINHTVKDEVRIIFIDQARFVEAEAIEQCYREIVDLLDKTDESFAVLHFGPVAFMSSMALGMLVRVNKKCKEHKVTLKLCNIIPDIRQVFKITGLEKVFDIYEDVTQAVAAFNKSGQLSLRKKTPASCEKKAPTRDEVPDDEKGYAVREDE